MRDNINKYQGRYNLLIISIINNIIRRLLINCQLVITYWSRTWWQWGHNSIQLL